MLKILNSKKFVKTNFKKLKKTKHMLKLFSDNPFDEIISFITDTFTKKFPNSKITHIEIINEPQWLSGGNKTEKNKVILVRSGMAVDFNITLKDDKNSNNLKGVFTWVGVNLNIKPRTNMWIDLDGNLEKFGKDGLLKTRIYELDLN